MGRHLRADHAPHRARATRRRCGAAVSANPDITIHTREPAGIIDEMAELAHSRGVTTFRFVDDLFLGYVASTSWTPQCGTFTSCGTSPAAVLGGSGPAFSSSVPVPAHRSGTGSLPRATTTPGNSTRQLLDYTAVDLTEGGLNEAMRGRDEFNFSVNIQFGQANVAEIRRRLVELPREQHQRGQTA